MSSAPRAGSARHVDTAAIDWGGARVEDGTLTVELVPAPARAWRQRFRRALTMLDRTGGDWEAIDLRRAVIVVRGVREGSEDRLRHMLDSAVVEAAGDVELAAPSLDPERDGQRARDRRMTDAFRQVAAP